MQVDLITKTELGDFKKDLIIEIRGLMTGVMRILLDLAGENQAKYVSYWTVPHPPRRISGTQ